MSKVKTSRPLGKEVRFYVPRTQAEFDSMTYEQRAALHATYRSTYDRFACPQERKPWEQ